MYTIDQEKKEKKYKRERDRALDGNNTQKDR